MYIFHFIQHRNSFLKPIDFTLLPVTAALFPLQRCGNWAQRKLFL